MHTSQKVCFADSPPGPRQGAGVEMDDGVHTVQARGCGVWPLPADPTCAGLARRAFRGAAAALSLDPALTDDGVTMVSELAANTLHAQREQRQQTGQGDRPGTPELWLYLRGTGPRRELVCKVFDAFPGWARGTVPGHGPHRPPADATSGRGLEVVHELSHGRWGYHLTRARHGGWQVRGKAVWFAVPAATAAVRPACLPARAAMTEFEGELAARGFAGPTVRADDRAADIAVLSLPGGLTVWCWCGTAWLHGPGLAGDQRSYCDLTEVAEQVVEAHESLAARPASALLAGAT